MLWVDLKIVHVDRSVSCFVLASAKAVGEKDTVLGTYCQSYNSLSTIQLLEKTDFFYPSTFVAYINLFLLLLKMLKKSENVPNDQKKKGFWRNLL